MGAAAGLMSLETRWLLGSRRCCPRAFSRAGMAAPHAASLASHTARCTAIGPSLPDVACQWIHTQPPPLYTQAKLGSQLNGEALDFGGWRQVTTAQHSDNASGAIARALDEFFHSIDGSGEDNQNKQMVRVDLGLDPKTGERLYALHPRREQKASARRLLPVFRRSAIASRLREETRVEPVVRRGKTIRKGRAGVKVGWRQFREGKCPCIKPKKTAECVCLKCSYLSSNLARLHVARRASP